MLRVPLPSRNKIPYNRDVSSIQNTLGPVTSVIGAQWGDEGKGKIVDILASEYDVIARACGGANAGHTIVVEGEKHVFHLMPSGCLHAGKDIVLGSGLVIHLPTLLKEIATLEEHGISIIDRLHISKAAHIVFDYHKEVDGVLEDQREEPIGTTKRGIGPAYMDKAARTGVRMERLGEDLSSVITNRVDPIKKNYGVDVDAATEIQNLKDAHAKIGSCICDTVEFLAKARSAGKTILVEGAQAVLLDIDHGTYPFVTSSSTTLAGALQGLGLPPMAVTSCIGVAKAYCTRVGEGDFATEAEGDAEERLRERGGEYGSTTGRPRRTGWLNIDQLNETQALNGFTGWNVTKLDVLDEEEVIPVMINSKLEELPGWKSSTAGLTSFEELPENAQKYIKRIEEETGVPATFIGTGPGREEMITKT
ncbi:MAG: adenylosuccinate synthase [Candidatus Peribacter sp.]|jgi:adenylosuccinate synthase|nr:adenylosuccinate synthase [Candidatus Peribacter sp.]MBT4392477.1 adenylosuccinate synthase [Candidatus Peribacter sp.]MBT4601306.1 adenylosuccinate synthase [Candidatus Peribacter sp.]MBT5149242.1 adenylosuccinate synthase [Candidatus Peribacter sp.]MBT5638032.1 adenylosuccinate synthase [Candidatus Peribacter sp.]